MEDGDEGFESDPRVPLTDGARLRSPWAAAAVADAWPWVGRPSLPRLRLVLQGRQRSVPGEMHVTWRLFLRSAAPQFLVGTSATRARSLMKRSERTQDGECS